MKLSKRTKRVGLVLAIILIGLSLWNASWLAPSPTGRGRE